VVVFFRGFFRVLVIGSHVLFGRNGTALDLKLGNKLGGGGVGGVSAAEGVGAIIGSFVGVVGVGAGFGVILGVSAFTWVSKLWGDSTTGLDGAIGGVGGVKIESAAIAEETVR
jgi:hypothetical protein